MSNAEMDVFSLPRHDSVIPRELRACFSGHYSAVREISSPSSPDGVDFRPFAPLSKSLSGQQLSSPRVAELQDQLSAACVVMSSKETLKQLYQLFASAVESKASTSSAAPAFPSLSLPPAINSLLDTHLSSFAASFPDSTSGSALSERERERTRWRDGLLEIWSLVEPIPGTEGDQPVIARVSAFLVLLEKVSADVKDDDDSALVTRVDIGKVWWDALLRRTILGTPKEPTEAEKDRSRGRRPAKRGKEVAPTSNDTVRPLTVSRVALAAATKIIVWGMCPSIADMERDPSFVPPFCSVVRAEYETRSAATLRGGDEWYGLRNVAECLMAWADKQPRPYFEQTSPYLSVNAPARVPFLALLLHILCRHSGKAYHVLQTPLLGNLVSFCLTSPSPAAVTLGIKSLTMFLVALPVLIGDHLFGIMAVYGRAVSWVTLGELDDAGEYEQETNAEAFDAPPPDPMALFTVLYGIYPCNFAAFLKDAEGYLKGKEWKGARGDGVLDLDSAMIRDRSKRLIRMHTLHPSLLTGDLATELTDTHRWRRLETADVMAECDRNVVQDHLDDLHDFRGGEKADGDDSVDVHEAESFLGRSRTRAHRPGRGPLALELEKMFAARDGGDVEEGDGATTSRRARTPVPRTASSSRSRSPTPHMPATTHFTNFQALQSASPRSSMSPGRSISRFREPEPLNFSSADSSALPSSNNSRASSIINSPIATPLSPLAASLMLSSAPEGGLSRSTSKATNIPTNAQIAKLETEIILLQGEVAFQTYLKQLHVAHMGTLHREKVLESGAEAERQSLYRTIRTLRAQLKQTKSSLDQLRSESGVTKANWIAHIDDLKDKLKTMREARLKWEQEGRVLRAELDESKEKEEKAKKELEIQGAEFFDLQNQVALDAPKLEKIADYEARIEALTKTLAICDEDLAKFTQQRREMDQLVGEWKRSELLRAATDAELASVKEQLRSKLQSEPSATSRAQTPLPPVTSTTTTKDDWTKMREEMERLRERNRELEEKVLELGE